MDKGDSASVNTHRVSTDNEADLLDITNITNSEKITEDVEDLVHDLESLLGESTDSFNVTSNLKFGKKDTSSRPGSGSSSNGKYYFIYLSITISFFLLNMVYPTINFIQIFQVGH